MDPFILEVAIAKIEQAQERILEHHREFKEEFLSIRGDFKTLNKAISDEASERFEADALIQQGCDQDAKNMYKAIAAAGFTALAALVMWIIDRVKFS